MAHLVLPVEAPHFSLSLQLLNSEPESHTTTTGPLSASSQTKMTRLRGLLHQLPKLVLPIPTQPPLETFTLFPKLPIELRVKIWGWAAMVPRDVELTKLRDFREPSKYQSVAPAIMHTCRESRAEGKRYYEYCIETPSVIGSNIVWINFSIDRFVLHPGYVLAYTNVLNFDDTVLNRMEWLLFHDCGKYFNSDLRRMERFLIQPKLTNFIVTMSPWDHLKFKPSEAFLLRDLDIRGREERISRIYSNAQKYCGWEKVGFRVEVSWELLPNYDHDGWIW